MRYASEEDIRLMLCSQVSDWNRGNSQLALAKQIGISAPILCQILNGKRSPRLRTLRKILKHLGYNPQPFYAKESE